MLKKTTQKKNIFSFAYCKITYFCNMKQIEEIAQTTAKFLLQVKAIKLNNNNPFTWASGRKSPIYCDNRVTLSYPEIRTYIRQRIADAITEKFGDFDVIAGVATGGIPQGVLVAQDLGKPFVYVRPEEKKHGLTNQIEGYIREGQTVVVVEDLVSTGKSSLVAVKALRDHGCRVKGMVAIFTYGLKVSEEAFAKENVDLITLTNYDSLIKVAIDEEYISEEDQFSLKNWRKDPEKWSEDHMNQ